MASAASIFPEIAGFNPTGVMQQSQLRQQQLGLNALQAQRQQAEIPLLQQQTQQAGLQNQLTQIRINDQKAIGAAWAQWDADADPSGQGLLKAAVKNGATPESVMGVQQHLAQYNASLATAEKTRLENQKMRDDDYAGKMQAIIDAPPEQQEGLWQNHVADFAKDAPGEQLPPHFTAQDAKTFLNLHQFRSQQIENELKKRQAENEAAGTTEKQAAAEKDKAEAERLKAVNALLKQGHDAQTTPGQHPIDAILSAQDDPGLNASLKGMYDRGAQFINPNTGISSVQEEALKLAATAKHEISQANNPQIRAGKVATTEAEARVKGPIETQTAVNTEASKLRLQQSLSTDVFAGIGNPTDRARATAEYQKLGTDYINSMEASQGLRDLISQAQHGNKAAPGLASIAELRTYLNRVTTPELRMVGGAGNLIDKVEGVLGGLTEGQPIPPDIMQGMDQIGAMQQQNAQRKYSNQLGLMGTTYGKTPPAFQWQPHSGQQPAAAAGAPKIRKYNPATGKLE